MTAWLEKLEAYEREGFREIPGPESNPKIVQWMQGPGGGKWVKSDATPWCGGTMAGIMDECGLGHVIPPEPLAAISWLKCGIPCEPKVGAIAVFPRAGGNHVTVIKRIDGHIWHCIGGNQSDSICTKPFDGREARGTRWPIKAKTPAEMTRESRIAAAAGRQQRDTATTAATGGGSQTPIPAPTSAVPEAIPPAPPPALPITEQIPDLLAKGQQWKGWLETGADLGTFVLGNWRLVLLGVAVYFLLRVAYDGMLIKQFRTSDHNEGHTT